MFCASLPLTGVSPAPCGSARLVLSAVSLSPPSPWPLSWTAQSCRWRSAPQRPAWTATSEPDWPRNPCSSAWNPAGRRHLKKKKGLKKNRFLPELRSLFYYYYLALTCVFLGPAGVLGSCFILISCWPKDGAGESERQQPGWGPSKDFTSKPANKQFGVSSCTVLVLANTAR